MKSLFRMLVLGYLLLALPIQGMAAALMLACVTGHGSTSTSHLRVDAPAPHVGLAHHTTVVASSDHLHSARHGPAIADQLLANDRADPSAEHDTPHLSGSTCSACAACCLMMHALPAGFDFSHSLASHGPVVPIAASPPPSHLPDGLERPPRRPLSV